MLQAQATFREVLAKVIVAAAASLDVIHRASASVVAAMSTETDDVACPGTSLDGRMLSEFPLLDSGFSMFVPPVVSASVLAEERVWGPIDRMAALELTFPCHLERLPLSLPLPSRFRCLLAWTARCPLSPHVVHPSELRPIEASPKFEPLPCLGILDMLVRV